MVSDAGPVYLVMVAVRVVVRGVGPAAGDAEMATSTSERITKLKLVVSPPGPLSFTVMEWVAGMVDGAAERVSVTEQLAPEGGVQDAGLNAALTPEGRPDTRAGRKLTGPGVPKT